MRTIPYSLFWAEQRSEDTRIKPEAKGQFVPKKDQVCSCGGARTRFEKSCKACRDSVTVAGAEFAYQGKALEQQANAWLKANGAKVNRRNELWEKTAPEEWEATAPQREFPMPQGFPKARGKLKGEF